MCVRCVSQVEGNKAGTGNQWVEHKETETLQWLESMNTCEAVAGLQTAQRASTVAGLPPQTGQLRRGRAQRAFGWWSQMEGDEQLSHCRGSSHSNSHSQSFQALKSTGTVLGMMGSITCLRSLYRDQGECRAKEFLTTNVSSSLASPWNQ